MTLILTVHFFLAIGMWAWHHLPQPSECWGWSRKGLFHLPQELWVVCAAEPDVGEIKGSDLSTLMIPLWIKLILTRVGMCKSQTARSPGSSGSANIWAKKELAITVNCMYVERFSTYMQFVCDRLDSIRTTNHTEAFQDTAVWMPYRSGARVSHKQIPKVMTTTTTKWNYIHHLENRAGRHYSAC